MDVPVEKRFRHDDSDFMKKIHQAAETSSDCIKDGVALPLPKLREFFFTVNIYLKKIERHLMINDPEFVSMTGAQLESLEEIIKEDLSRSAKNVALDLTNKVLAEEEEEEPPASQALE